jgi:FdhD protein
MVPGIIVARMEILRRNSTMVRLVRVRNETASERLDSLAGEEPMEIRVGVHGEPAAPVAVTMRTPGNDFELAAGFLFTEGLTRSEDVLQVSYCDDLEGGQAYNVVTVRVRRPIPSPSARNFYATSSCGICGKAALDQVEVSCRRVDTGLEVAGAVIMALAGRLRRSQKLFERTGGLHAAGLFAADGALVAVSEDVGRHNAVDKVVGRMILEHKMPLSEKLLMVSGRASFEIVQKAAIAGVPFVCAVSAPTNLAVDAAARLGVTLIGFLRDDGFNVYSHAERVLM